MFNKEELQWLYMAANTVPTPQSTAMGKTKAHMIFKLCDELDKIDQAQAKAPAPPSEQEEDLM